MQRRKRFLSLVLCLCLLAGMTMGNTLVTRAQDSAVLLDVSEGRLHIEADGYYFEGKEKTAHTGAYILTGSGTQEIYFGGNAEYDITLLGLHMDSSQYRSALTVGDGTVLNLTVIGENSVCGHNHPGITLNGSGSARANLYMTAGSSLRLGRGDGGTPVSVNPNVELTVTDLSGAGLTGADDLDNRNTELYIHTNNDGGHIHTVSWEAAENGHRAVCGGDGCGQALLDQEFSHVMEVSYSENGHGSVCRYCGLEQEMEPHTMTDWEYLDEDTHSRFCSAGCGYRETEEHHWEETGREEGTAERLPVIHYVCGTCGGEKQEEDHAQAIGLYMEGGDWDGAAVAIYRNGEFWRAETCDSYEKEVWLPYDSGATYVFRWSKGQSDDECGLAIQVPGSDDFVYEREDFHELSDGAVIFALGTEMADYSSVEAALAEIPSDLSVYTYESVQKVLDAREAVDWGLMAEDQDQVEAYAEAIRASVAGLRRYEEGQTGVMEILLEDEYGDGWNGAALSAYRDGELLQRMTIEEGEEAVYILPYAEESCYVFQWSKGEYDEECSVRILLPEGEESSRDGFDLAREGEIVLSLNRADYSSVEEALGKVPSDLWNYTQDSVAVLNEAIAQVNWYLPAAEQAQAEAYAEAIQSAVAQLAPYSEGEAGFLHILLKDSWGDGWNGAHLQVYQNGERIDSLAIADGVTEDHYLAYDPEAVYVFQWEKGGYDEECSVEIRLPGEDGPVYSREDMEDVRNGSVLFSLNRADYGSVEAAIGQIPEDMSVYTYESVAALNKVRNSVDWYLPAADQEQAEGYAEAILEAIEGLVLSEGQEGLFDVSAGNLYITETGYRRSFDGQEIPYTGRYVLCGQTDSFRVVVESGSHSIELMEVSMDNSGFQRENGETYASPIEICEGASVSLSLTGNNVLVSGDWSSAGLNVGEGAALRIEESAGVLEAYGDNNAAGIGGNEDQAAGEITIDGGTVYGYSKDDGAGIGGGYRGGAGIIVINGGTVYAECQDNDGAGIGCGDGGNGGSVTINGGAVTALSLDDEGSGIGGAGFGRIDSVTINGGVIIAGAAEGAAIGGGYGSGRGGAVVINDGIILISDSHSGQNIIGRGNGVYAGEMEGDTVRINGGNILSDSPEAVAPAPRNGEGELLKPFRFTADESQADKRVQVIYGEDRVMEVTAYGTDILVYLPEDTDAETVEIRILPADYTAVDEALAKVPEDLSVYTEESAAALKAAIAGVARDLDYTRQDEVDAMAEAIEKALAGLVLREEPETPGSGSHPGGGENGGNENTGGGAGTGTGTGPVSTGDGSAPGLYLALLMTAAALLVFAGRRKKTE